MVFIKEPCGIAAVCIVYTSIIIANAAFVNIVILPRIEEGSTAGAYTLLAFYELIICLVVWSHMKTMFSEPGYIPKNYSVYKRTKLPQKY